MNQPVIVNEAMHSENISELMTALSKAQGAMGHASKDRQAHQYKYATLASVWDTARDPLAANGLALTQIQRPGRSDTGIELVTILGHSSGQWIKSVMPIMFGRTKDIQGLGSGITYSRRYAMLSLVGICPDDDDGAAAVLDGVGPAKSVPIVQGVIDEDQLADLSLLVEQFPNPAAVIADICTNSRVKNLSVLPAAIFKNVYDHWKLQLMTSNKGGQTSNRRD